MENMEVNVATDLVLSPLRFSSLDWIVWKAFKLNGRLAAFEYFFILSFLERNDCIPSQQQLLIKHHLCCLLACCRKYISVAQKLFIVLVFRKKKICLVFILMIRLLQKAPTLSMKLLKKKHYLVFNYINFISQLPF